MTIRITRAVLLRRLLRSADRDRIGRVIDRLQPRDLSALLMEHQLNEFELRRAALVLFAPERVERTVYSLEDPALARLLATAAPGDLEQALLTMAPADAARVLALIAERRRTRLLDSIAGELRERIVRALPRRARPRQDANGVLRSSAPQRRSRTSRPKLRSSASVLVMGRPTIAVSSAVSGSASMRSKSAIPADSSR